MKQQIEEADQDLGSYEKDLSSPDVLAKSKNTLPVLGGWRLYLDYWIIKIK